MITLTASRKYRHTRQELFEAIDSIQKSAHQRELGSFSIARENEPASGFDARFSFILMKFELRVNYCDSRPAHELKQIKGRLKEYTCAYNINETGSESEVIISLGIRLPYGPLGFLVSLLARPLYAYRLGRELKLLGKIMEK